MDDPSTNGGNGRDPRTGRFAKGNTGGPGNPNAQHVAKLRDGFRSACTLADVRAICRRLVAMAKKGNVLAAREVLDRTIGKSAMALEHAGADNPNSVIPVFEILVVDRSEALEFEQIRDQMRRQIWQAGARDASVGLPAPVDD